MAGENAVRLTCLSWVILALVGAGASLPADAQAPNRPNILLASPGGQVIGVTGLSANTDCLPAEGTGRVTARRMGQDRRSLTGITFLDARFGSSMINLDTEGWPREPEARAALQRAVDELLQVGRTVTLGLHGCGAAGAVQYVSSIRIPGTGPGVAAPRLGPPTASSAPVMPSDKATAGGTAALAAAGWTYGRHPVLGLSAYIEMGDEAVGLACNAAIPDPTRDDVLALRFTPGLAPYADRQPGPLMLIEDGQGVGNHAYQRRPGGYFERVGNSCSINLQDFRIGRTLRIYPDAEAEGFDPRGATVRQGGQRHTVPIGRLPSVLIGGQSVPLAGSGAAIRQLVAACAALRQDIASNCGL